MIRLLSILIQKKKMNRNGEEGRKKQGNLSISSLFRLRG
jgi:hypothetical protein